MTTLNNEFWNYCKNLELEDIDKLSFKLKETSVNYNKFDILHQVEGLKIAKQKLPSWYKQKVVYPPKLSMEQCSSEATAKYKSKIIQEGSSMIDLTAGFGVDCAFLSTKFKECIYTEKNENLHNIVKYNYKILGLEHVHFLNADAIETLEKLSKTNLIYIDPARRNITGKKTVAIEDCEPNIIKFQEQLYEKSEQVLIKLSPMLDIEQSLKKLMNVHSVHIVSVNNECKELLFLLQNKKYEKINFHCINIKENHISEYIFNKEAEIETSPTISKKLKNYIYEPNTSIMKAGAFKSIAKDFKIEKLHPNSHLYTSDILIDKFPGRIFELENFSSLNNKELIKKLKNIEQANIAIRNLPMTSDQLRKKLKLKEGGNTYIFGTTLSDDQKVILICKKLVSSNHEN